MVKYKDAIKYVGSIFYPKAKDAAAATCLSTSTLHITKSQKQKYVTEVTDYFIYYTDK